MLEVMHVHRSVKVRQEGNAILRGALWPWWTISSGQDMIQGGILKQVFVNSYHFELPLFSLYSWAMTNLRALEKQLNVLSLWIPCGLLWNAFNTKPHFDSMNILFHQSPVMGASITWELRLTLLFFLFSVICWVCSLHDSECLLNIHDHTQSSYAVNSLRNPFKTFPDV